MTRETLGVVMPVYNEQDIVEKVLKDWVEVLNDCAVDYQIHVYNDGSRDNTLDVLKACSQKYPNMTVHNKENSGHGPTLLLAYKENVDKYTWLFQVDSDDELPAEAFPVLWSNREESDFVLGRRSGRTQSLGRKIVSMLSRATIRLFYGKSVWDVNSPYRLMRSDAFKSIFFAIPDTAFAPNVIISGMVALKKMRFKEFPLTHSHRTTGIVSIAKFKLAKSAFISFCETIAFRLFSKDII